MRRVQFQVLLMFAVFCATLSAQVPMQQQVRLDPSTARVVQEVGIIVQQTDSTKRPAVFMVIGDGPKGASFKGEDKILSINKKRVTTLAGFDKAYGAVKVGETAEFEIEREGKKQMLSFKKPKPQVTDGPVRIQRTQ